MAKELSEQWTDALWSPERPLLVLPPHVDTDMFAAACALGHALRSAGKEVTLLCPRPTSLHAKFLVKNLSIVQSLEETKIYQCVFPRNVTVTRVSHEIFPEGGATVRVTLAPQANERVDGQLTVPAGEETLRFNHALPDFDRIIVLGARDISEIAVVFGEAHGLLSSVPLVSLPFHTDAEAFGQWNITHEIATTESEVVAHALLVTAPDAVRDHVATCLMAGLIAKTKYFRTEQVTPAMLTLAGTLTGRGAERMRILEELYRTRSLDTMRLWGFAYARISEIAPGILATTLTREDFITTHTKPELLHEVAGELLQTHASARAVLFVHPHEQSQSALVFAKRPLDARTFFGALRTEGSRDCATHIFPEQTPISDIYKSFAQAFGTAV